MASTTYLGCVAVDGRQADASGQKQTLEDGSLADRLDGFGSGIASTAISNRYLLLADRGPNKTPYPGGELVDNTTSYFCRFQIADINVTEAGGAWSVTLKPVGTTILRNEQGNAFVGLASLCKNLDPALNLRFDPESIRVGRDSSVYVSDEYGPSVYRFDAQGRRVAALPVPTKFRPEHLLPTEKAEIEANKYVANSGHGGGRRTNKGFEGLAITPDGSHLIAALQAPLLQDGPDHSRYIRFVSFDLEDPSRPAREFVYPLEADPDKTGNHSITGISEILALDDHRLLVDERDGEKPNQYKYIFVADLAAATDVSDVYSLADLPKERFDAIKLIAKQPTPLIDLKQAIGSKLPAPLDGYSSGLPEKIEGLAFGPDLPDGRHLLLVTNDNDFLSPTGKPSFSNYVFAFAIDKDGLPGFTPQTFAGEQSFGTKKK